MTYIGHWLGCRRGPPPSSPSSRRAHFERTETERTILGITQDSSGSIQLGVAGVLPDFWVRFGDLNSNYLCENCCSDCLRKSLLRPQTTPTPRFSWKNWRCHEISQEFSLNSFSMPYKTPSNSTEFSPICPEFPEFPRLRPNSTKSLKFLGHRGEQEFTQSAILQRNCGSSVSTNSRGPPPPIKTVHMATKVGVRMCHKSRFVHHILCESPFISRDFYVIRPLI